MKKFLVLLLASFLFLTACGNKEESKTEDKKETKSEGKDKKKDNYKNSDDDEKNNDGKDENQLATSDNQQQDNTTQEPIQSQEQPAVQNQQGLSETEIQNEINEKANTEEGAEVIRRLGEQGIKVQDPNQALGTDAQGTEEMDAFAKKMYEEEQKNPIDESQIEEAHSSEDLN